MTPYTHLETPLAWSAFHRFLLIGDEQGVCESPLPDLAQRPTPVLDGLLAADGIQAVRLAANWLLTGRSHQPEPALYVLARAVTHGDERTRREALEWLPVAPRTGAQLLRLAAYMGPSSLWPRELCAAIGDWYGRRTAVELVNMVMRSPDDHRELLGRIAPKAPTRGHAAVYRWIVLGVLDGPMLDDPGLELLSAHALLKTTHSEAVVAVLLRRWPQLREETPDSWLRYPSVWRQILPTLSSGALVRWLPRLAATGLLEADSRVTAAVLQRLALGGLGRTPLAASAAIRALGALRHHGMGDRPRYPEALDAALLALFHERVRATAPTGGSLVIAVDQAASTAIDGLPGLPGLSPRTAFAALTLMAAATAREVHLLAYGKEPVRVELSPDERIDTLLAKLDGVPHAPMDGAAAIRWAERHDVRADAFVTLSGTRPPRGAEDPRAARAAYRDHTGREALWLGVTTGAHRLCPTLPLDLHMMEARGLDATTPGLLLDLLGGAA